jgi:hypothetical protein
LGLAWHNADASAQQPSDFSGHWTLDAPVGGRGRGGAGPTLGSGWGPSFTIVQRGDTLIVERAFFAPGDLQPPMRFRYSLTGARTENRVLMGRGFQRQASTAAWEGDRLVITTTFDDPTADAGRAVTSRVRYTLSSQPAGREAHPPLLVIETWREGVMGGPASTVRSVYVRS